MTNRGNKNNSNKTEEKLRTQEPQEHTKKENKPMKQTHEARRKKSTETNNAKDFPKQGKRNTEIEHHEPHYVTIQTREGIYEAGHIIDNANNFPVQGNSTWTEARYKNLLN